MASNSKRARMAPVRNLNKTFLYWAVGVFVVKLVIIFSIKGGNIEILEKSIPLNGIWLGADGENYLKGYEALINDGFFSREIILSYWPAGYPLIMFLLSILGKSEFLFSISIFQSIIFSYAAYFFAIEISKTKLKKFTYLTFLLILFNPTLSLSSIVLGYESLAASGLLICTGFIVRSFTEKNNKKFFKYLTISSLIFSLLAFIQPRFILTGVLVNIVWISCWKRFKFIAPVMIISLVILMFFPTLLIYRNNQAVGINSISTNLGTTMNIGAGNNATGGYMKEGFGVPCRTVGTITEQDIQTVKCVLTWYLENPKKSVSLFYNKSVYFWSPWINNRFAGDVFTGTMFRNPWLKISPLTNIEKNQQGANLIYGNWGKAVSWLWLIGGLVVLFYGYLILWQQKSLERLIGNIVLIIVTINWLITLFTIGDHRFRVPIMGLSLFLQAIGLKTLFKGGKAPIVDGPSLR